MQRQLILPAALLWSATLTAMAVSVLTESKPRTHAQTCKAATASESASMLSFTQYNTEPEKLLFRVVAGQGTLVTPQQLQTIRSVTDLMPDFPENWIDTYQNVALENAGGEKVRGTDIRFNQQQKQLLQEAPVNSTFKLHVAYTKERDADIHTMEVLFCVVPEQQAQFGENYQDLMNYLDQAGIQDFSPSKHPEAQGLMVDFTVSATGAVGDIQFSKALNDNASEEKLRSILANMPTWSPAKNAEGVPVAQKFSMQLGMWRC